MEKIDLTELYPLQEELDNDIASRHNIDYKSTNEKRILALLVELGEFANETRCFKFWSLKGPSAKEVILDEFADGMHFFISLGIALNVDKKDYDISRPSETLTNQILKVYSLIIDFFKNQCTETYYKAFSEYLNILSLLDYSGDDAKKAYLSKLSVNHKRQETAY